MNSCTVPQAVLESLLKEQLSIFLCDMLAHELVHSGQLGHAAHSYGARIAPPRPFRLELTCLGALPCSNRPVGGMLTMFSCSLCAGMCVLLRAGRFLFMQKVRPRRGAASGGERRSHGAARSIAAPQAARGRAQAVLRPAARARVVSLAGLRRPLIGGRAR